VAPGYRTNNLGKKDIPKNKKRSKKKEKRNGERGISTVERPVEKTCCTGKRCGGTKERTWAGQRKGKGAEERKGAGDGQRGRIEAALRNLLERKTPHTKRFINPAACKRRGESHDEEKPQEAKATGEEKGTNLKKNSTLSPSFEQKNQRSVKTVETSSEGAAAGGEKKTDGREFLRCDRRPVMPAGK